MWNKCQNISNQGDRLKFWLSNIPDPPTRVLLLSYFLYTGWIFYRNDIVWHKTVRKFWFLEGVFLIQVRNIVSSLLKARPHNANGDNPGISSAPSLSIRVFLKLYICLTATRCSLNRIVYPCLSSIFVDSLVAHKHSSRHLTREFGIVVRAALDFCKRKLQKK